MPCSVESFDFFRPYEILSTDVDHDDDIDLIVRLGTIFGPDFPPQLIWYENQGAGTFAEKRTLVKVNSTGATTVDLDGDGDIDILTAVTDGRILWYENRPIGDSNDDGIFDSGDLVDVFAAGKYEDGIADNATFDEGDWNQDGDFDTSDLVLAFQGGHYVAAARPMTAEIAAAVDWLFLQTNDAMKSRAFVA